MDQIKIDREQIRLMTRNCLKLAVIEYRDHNPDRGSFILPDVLGSNWTEEFMPFYSLYGVDRVAGQEMGKLLSVVAKDLGLRNTKENRFGKKDAITRYFF